jgi:hypothetical protein
MTAAVHASTAHQCLVSFLSPSPSGARAASRACGSRERRARHSKHIDVVHPAGCIAAEALRKELHIAAPAPRDSRLRATASPAATSRHTTTSSHNLPKSPQKRVHMHASSRCILGTGTRKTHAPYKFTANQDARVQSNPDPRPITRCGDTRTQTRCTQCARAIALLHAKSVAPMRHSRSRIHTHTHTHTHTHILTHTLN